MTGFIYDSWEDDWQPDSASAYYLVNEVGWHLIGADNVRVRPCK
jgi:hypothetical protein